MLVVKVYVNTSQIDELWIHNIGDSSHGRCKYRIEKPEGYEDYEIEHLRAIGYRGLLLKALEGLV